MEINQITLTGNRGEGIPSRRVANYFNNLEKILETNIFGRSLSCAVLKVSLS